jgi:hypothetical protein
MMSTPCSSPPRTAPSGAAGVTGDPVAAPAPAPAPASARCAEEPRAAQNVEVEDGEVSENGERSGSSWL